MLYVDTSWQVAENADRFRFYQGMARALSALPRLPEMMAQSARFNRTALEKRMQEYYGKDSKKPTVETAMEAVEEGLSFFGSGKKGG